MELHHTKHHQAYVNGLNAAEEQLAKAQSIKEQISLQSAIKFNGGGASTAFHVFYMRTAEYSLSILLFFLIPGHINHSFFWKILAPTSKGGGHLLSGKLKSTLEKDFGSVEDFKKAFNAKAAALQGSGWCWLVRITPEHTGKE
jgi:Fe-Mn family superoxide dismutase